MAVSLPAAFLSEDQFSCSICLEVFTKPVTTPCGHSFCQSCISSYWDGGRHTYQCPLCKESFHKRPELHVNLTLKEITEQFKQMASSPIAGRVGGIEHPNSHPHHNQPLSPTLPRQGEMPENIFAEMMTRFQQLADPGSNHQSRGRDDTHFAKMEHHGPPPPYSPPCSVRSSSDSSSDLPKCPIHLRGLEFFCRTDNICVCSTCVETTDHLGHNVTPAKREWHIKKAQLGIAEVELKDLIHERERKVKEIHNSLQEIQAAAERETNGVVCAFSKLISSVERCQSEVVEVIEVSLQAVELRAYSMLRELEEEIDELKKRSTTLSQMALSEDYIFFLKTFPALSAPPQAKNRSRVSVSSQLTSGVILRSVNQMIEHFHKELRKLPEVCQQSSSNPSLSRPNPKVRRVQEYAADITLDPNTAHPRLTISADGKQVHCGDHHQLVPDNPERFDRVVCVLAHQGFSLGRHYWEVEVGGKTDWDLGVASRSISRKGKITVSPAHGYWFLSLRDRTEYAFRTEPSTNLTLNIRPSRIGIYVDYDKGLVSFYNVDAKVLIFTFTDSFSGTIHPFFSPCTNKSGQNEAPLIICPVAMAE
ncbi:zinc finger protein RFP-like [Archocentrus centrarchus]|uniref:zinc finger protein RFP-like n=1 Tax=Archocentrus centrarchus TaxID=63155 RepID=UPI0011E9C168|nr:zinc finger protein RFP-like [Archocentrus centrarchus]